MAAQSQRTSRQQQQQRDETPPQAATAGGGAATSANGGPRVSFNRDVHVKRIGKRSNEPVNYETTNLQPPQSAQPYHQLPADLSAESIRKEAALVLAQAERHTSTAANGDKIPLFKVKSKRPDSSVPDKFHSLPTRKKRATVSKPVSRSVSDASAKSKPPSKRPSIFSIFSRKSDSNVAGGDQVERDPRFEDSGGRRLVRSKSDVGSYHKPSKKPLTKETKAQSQEAGTETAKPAPTQLSPIIENAQKEDYFEEQFNRERRKSEAITDREKHESGLNELIERTDQQHRHRHQSPPPSDHKSPTTSASSGLLGRTPVSSSIKDKILTLQSQAGDNMHSSQLPAQKLPLTKGVTVNGLVKRLSMERFSPPPPLSGTAFSYIRPNEGITYAQLDLSDDQHAATLGRRGELPRQVRDFRSPERSFDVTDFATSHGPRPTFGHGHGQGHSHSHGHSYSHNSRVLIESPQRDTRDSFSPTATGPAAGPTTIRISSSHSPSPWQQLSPRNLSDEDEGLGAEPRKYFDEDFRDSAKSPPEPPIVPVIRSLTPPPPSRDNGFDHDHVHDHGRFRSPPRGGDDHVDPDLGYRRARLESRILTRRFGGEATAATLEREGRGFSRPSPVRDEYPPSQPRRRYQTPDREDFGARFHKPQTTEILQKYSPERSHLDIISPAAAGVGSQHRAETKTSRYKHTKYYDDGAGGVKEVYERETRTDGHGEPQVRESRHRERLDSSAERPQLTDYEPKSLDSQFTSTDQYRSSPENMKRYEGGHGHSHGHGLGPSGGVGGGGFQQREDPWQSSLKRDKLQQRSFDKGDSGIENDFRKESFNGDLTTRWRKRTVADDMRACETFLKKERRHTEQQQQQQQQVGRRTDSYVYRERSIDDGSHYDPHLDKYPTATSTLRRQDRPTQTQPHGQETLKRTKKVGGFEKVKQLFTGGGGGGGSGGGGGGSGSSSSHGSKKENVELAARAGSTTSSAQTLPKDKYMVKEEEMRSRYREHRASLQNELREPKTTDISMRRRLSTPKASPLLIKRSPSEKKPSPLVQKNSNASEKPEKTSWFKSLDRRSKSKSKEKLDVSVNGQHESSSMKRSKTSSRSPAAAAATAAPPIPPKNLRFFGDTDLDSNPPTVSRASTTLKSRPSVAAALNRSQKYSQSAFHLDRINGSPQQRGQSNFNSNSTSTPGEHLPGRGGHGFAGSAATTRHKSTSLHNLDRGGGDEVDFRKRRHYSRSRDLDDISESGSDTEEQHKRQTGVKMNGGSGSGSGSRSLSRERLDRSHRYDEHAYRRSSDRQTPATPATTMLPNGDGSSSSTLRRSHPHLLGPPKPARSAERRAQSSYSRERDRYPAESSGTEGESSLHSQRSVVYLHATTVGAIPQPYHLRRRAISRDDLRSHKGKHQPHQPLQPMTRTVSRSVSMLAPWKPKLISEGYEINYSQEQNKRMTTLPRKPAQQHLNGSSSTLTRPSKKGETPSTRSRRHELLKDDQSSLRNSSTTSASKSALSSNLRPDGRRLVK